jgi:hypothetical protein
VTKPISWSYRLHEIQQRIAHSRLENWSRRDLENLFELKRAAAQNLMKTVGGVQVIGGTHFVERSALLAFLDLSIASDDLSATVQQQRLESGPKPRPKRLVFALPAELRTLMAADLPDSIRLEAGKLTIVGADGLAIVEQLYLLAQALQNDLDSVLSALDPAPVVPAVDDEDLRALFRELRPARN